MEYGTDTPVQEQHKVDNDNVPVCDTPAQHTLMLSQPLETKTPKVLSCYIHQFKYFFNSLVTVQLLIANLPLAQ